MENNFMSLAMDRIDYHGFFVPAIERSRLEEKFFTTHKKATKRNVNKFIDEYIEELYIPIIDPNR